MKEFSFRNPEIIRPPGSLYDIVSHPIYHNSRSIEIAVFNEHRYSFFYWNKWKKKLGNKYDQLDPPALVSLDWHQDLVFPCDTEKEWLRSLDLKNNSEVAFFSWAKLNTLNDGHILSAAYLNLIGDIYVNCRQGKFDDDWGDEKIMDIYGNPHIVKKFKEFSDLEKTLLVSDEQSIFFDIDLDYFTIKNGLSDGGFKNTYMPDSEIKNILSPNRPLINWIFQRLEGMTVALEPEHTGGLLRSNKYLGLINNIYFKPGLFSHKGNWRHVTEGR